MASTDIAAMVIRTITADHLAAEFPSASALMASGAVQIDTNPPFRGQGGQTFIVPEYLEYTAADAVIPDDDTEGTRNSLATSSDTGVVCRREVGISVKDSAAIASGQNIDTEINRQAPAYWAKRVNIALYNCLTGAFTTAGVLNTASWSYSPGTPFQRSAIPNVMKAAAVRDQWPKFSVWVMRGVQFADAYNDGIVTYVNAGSFGERLLTTGEVPTIAGKQVVVDDTIPETDGTTYLAQPNALYLGFQTDMTVEPFRRADLGGGLTDYWVRQHFMPHVRRLVYGGANNPANSTLATAASWTLATAASTDPKLVKVFRVKFENA